MENIKIHVSIAVIGHINSGKSTIVGNLLYKRGNLDKNTLEKFEKDVKDLGLRNLEYSWLQYKLKAERDRGITIDNSFCKFQTENFCLTIIDTPGHRDYIKNMLTGTSQADVALLIVASEKGEFERGFSKYGQTKEHILLAFTLGVKQMIVCVNKLDDSKCNWSQARFEEIKSEVSQYLIKVGYDSNKILFIPLSGLFGDNLVKYSPKFPWYNGPTLLAAFDQIIPPIRYIDKPLRIPIQSVYKISGIGTVPVGRVETGSIKPGITVIFAPSEISAVVKSVQMYHEDLQVANSGDIIGFNIKSVSDKDIKSGHVASDIQTDPAKKCKSFTAQVIVLNFLGYISAGYTPILDCHTAHIACRFQTILKKIDRKTGATIENQPKFIKSEDTAMVVIKPTRPMCVETFHEYPPLGRFSVRDMRQTVAVGIIKEVLKKEIGASRRPVISWKK